jgi:hypothetical protein
VLRVIMLSIALLVSTFVFSAIVVAPFAYWHSKHMTEQCESQGGTALYSLGFYEECAK